MSFEGQGGDVSSASALRVLVAEDNPVNQEVAIGFLESLGCDVTVVENGADAVKTYQASPDHFDVILMDCQMPVMDGFEATRQIRASETETQHVPILALTANAFEGSKASCLEAGMDDMLNKPLRRQELDVFLSQLRLKYGDSKPPPTEREPVSSSLVLDLQQLESLKALDPDGSKGLIRRAAVKFADYGDQLVANMARSLADGDMAEMSRLAHSLKSSSANLGAMDLSSQCQAVEAAAQNLEKPRDIGQQIEALTRAYQTARKELLALVES